MNEMKWNEIIKWKMNEMKWNGIIKWKMNKMKWNKIIKWKMNKMKWKLILSFRLQDFSRWLFRQLGSSGQCRFSPKSSFLGFSQRASISLWSPVYNTEVHFIRSYFLFLRSTTQILGVVLFYFLGIILWI